MEPTGDRPTVGFAAPPDLAAVSVRYELQAELGRGGMGIVYRARDRRTGGLVALKAIHPSFASDPRSVERFTNELLLARRITHKNVCRVHDLNEFGGTLVISMELVEGRSLRQMLQDVDGVSIRQGVRIARQIAGGLAEAHAQGVVHRDLKPENILIARDGSVKVMDFGIARLADSRLTATGHLIGTPAYMSPEQAAGKPADARSDIYSFGLVLYEMFCGRPAFAADTPVALVAKHVMEMPVAPREIESDLPLRIDEAIRRCLEKDPDKRFQSVAELDAALSSGSLPLSATTEPETVSAAAHVDSWRRTDWALVAAAAMGLVMFYVSFSRVSLAPRSQVTFDRSVLRRIAEEHLQRLGVTAPITQVGGTVNPGLYVYVASTYGAAFARDAANNPVHYWTWSAAFDGGSLDVDHRGRLTSFGRPVVPVDSSAKSPSAARSEAAHAVEDFFGRPVGSLVPEQETRAQTYEFAWLDPPDHQPIRMRYRAGIDNAGVSSLSASPVLPPGFSLEFFPFGEVTMNEWGLPVGLIAAVLLCVFGFLGRRRVTQSATWRHALVIVSFVAAVGYTVASYRFFGPGDMVAVPLGFGVLLATVVYLASIAVETLLARTRRRKLDTLAALFGGWRRGHGSGLAILRGSLIGLLLLGIDTTLIWIATTWFHGRLSMIHAGLMGGIISGSAWPAGIVLGVCALQMVGLSLLVAVVDAIADRVPVRRWASVTAAIALLAASGVRLSMAAVQPVRFTVAVLLVDYALLLMTFRVFDLLTLCAAIGTFALWWANYPIFVMQQPIGATGPWLVFAGWALVVAAAAALAFKSSLGRGYRRVTTALD